MTRVKLIHWKPAEAEQRAEKLQACGYEVDHVRIDGPAELRQLTSDPPAVIVIDLSRAPSQGRDMAIALRRVKATRHTPLVFVEGDPDKVAGIKELLPDATYTTWKRIRAALGRAVTKTSPAKRSPSAAVPDQMAGYSGTPLVKKLGIKAESVVVLVGAPAEFESLVGELPAGAVWRRGNRGRRDLCIWFPQSLRELEDKIDALAAQVGNGGLWIAWPKQASGVKTDLTQNLVRQIGLAAGLVDYKICAIDATWSGLKFARRKDR